MSNGAIFRNGKTREETHLGVGRIKDPAWAGLGSEAHHTPRWNFWANECLWNSGVKAGWEIPAWRQHVKRGHWHSPGGEWTQRRGAGPSGWALQYLAIQRGKGSTSEPECGAPEAQRRACVEERVDKSVQHP